MDHLYAFEVEINQLTQYLFADYTDHLILISKAANPMVYIDFVGPFISVFDSVFGAQLYLCSGCVIFTVTILKWLLAGERPYWWVQRSQYYTHSRPKLTQHSETCEMSPGTPSLHSALISMTILLILIWISHVLNDKRWKFNWWKKIVYPLFVCLLVCSVVSRVFVAASFLHQCLFGILVGAILSPAVCIFITDPYFWGKTPEAHMDKFKNNFTKALFLVLVILVIYYWDQKKTLIDASKSCHLWDWLNEESKQLITLIQSLALIMGWTYGVSSDAAKYRYYTKRRSLLAAILTTFPLICLFIYIQKTIYTVDSKYKILIYFVIAFLKPIVCLKIAPKIAILPFFHKNKKLKKN